jgi:hypothetical protein
MQPHNPDRCRHISGRVSKFQIFSQGIFTALSQSLTAPRQLVPARLKDQILPRLILIYLRMEAVPKLAKIEISAPAEMLQFMNR